MIKFIHMLSVFFLCGCTGAGFTVPFPIDENGSFEKVSRIEVCRAKKLLAAATSNTLVNPKSEGMFVFDGIAIEAKIFPNKKQEILFEVNSVLLGYEHPIPKKIKLITPIERFGGVTVAIGEEYRVGVFPVNNKYYTWATMGTAPKDLAFRGFYSCNKK